jgi:hypothetical protein
VKYDIVMIVGDEPNAEEHWRHLRALVPRALCVPNAASIHAVYGRAASLATTSHFFMVDGDNWVYPHFLFETDFLPARDEATFWLARNPVNGLAYTHGGIKLLPTESTEWAAPRNANSLDIAISLTIHHRRRVIPLIASEHRFNTSPFATWRTAFRECTKLVFTLNAARNRHELTEHLFMRWLETWCSKGADATFGKWSLLGAREGRAFGNDHYENQEMLLKINDYQWLSQLFDQRHR